MIRNVEIALIITSNRLSRQGVTSHPSHPLYQPLRNPNTFADLTSPTIRYDTIRYDARCYFNVRSKGNMSQLNLPHGNDD